MSWGRQSSHGSHSPVHLTPSKALSQEVLLPSALGQPGLHCLPWCLLPGLLAGTHPLGSLVYFLPPTLAGSPSCRGPGLVSWPLLVGAASWVPGPGVVGTSCSAATGTPCLRLQSVLLCGIWTTMGTLSSNPTTRVSPSAWSLLEPLILPNTIKPNPCLI